MAHISSTKPFHHRLEQRELPQPSYHRNDICGSSLHGLATTLEYYAQQNTVSDGLKQIQRCIAARQYEIEARAHPDPAHNLVIVTLTRLYNLYKLLHQYDERYLARTIVRYDDSKHLFNIYVDNKPLTFTVGRGGSKRTISRKNKSRKNKSRKNKSRKIKSSKK